MGHKNKEMTGKGLNSMADGLLTVLPPGALIHRLKTTITRLRVRVSLIALTLTLLFVALAGGMSNRNFCSDIGRL